MKIAVYLLFVFLLFIRQCGDLVSHISVGRVITFKDKERTGFCTGFIFAVQKDGKAPFSHWIATTNHCILPGEIAWFNISNKSYKLTPVAADPENDLAIFEFEAPIKYQALTSRPGICLDFKSGLNGKTKSMRVWSAGYENGSKIIKIKTGNLIDCDYYKLQIKGRINFGMSGAPVVNENGEVLGVITEMEVFHLAGCHDSNNRYNCIKPGSVFYATSIDNLIRLLTQEM